MKKILFIVLSLCVTELALAGVSVPEIIKIRLAERFPNASQIVWTEQTSGLYEAEFTLDQQHFAALLDKKGTLLHAGETINWFQIPAMVRQNIAKDYLGFNMALMIKENGQYMTEFAYHGSNYLIVFDPNGKITTSK